MSRSLGEAAPDIEEVPPAERQTQSDRALAALRASILSGALPPGSKLKIERLQQEFELSSSPLREALNRLAAEGLVVTEENRGFRAAPVTVQDLQDLTRLRITVEVQTLRDAIAHGDDGWRDRLEATHALFSAQDRDVSGGHSAPDGSWTSHHKAFHMALIAGSPYPRMLALCSSLFDQTERYRRLSARFRSTPRDAGDEHRRLLDTVLARKADMAALLLIDHIEDTTRHVAQVLEALPEAHGPAARMPRKARG